MKTAPWWNDVRTPIAFLVAPFAVPLIATIYFRSEGAPDSAIALVVAGSLIVSYAGTLIFGAPLYLFLRGRKATAFVLAPALGFMVGALVITLLLGRSMSSGNLGFGGFSGAAVGTILWLIARPDRQTQ